MRNDRPFDWYENNAVQWSEASMPTVRAWYEWDGIRSLLPEVAGARVLDAGCGDGTFSHRLARRGADVVGIDGSRRLLKLAVDRFGDEIDVLRADLREPLTFLTDGSFDIVISQLALDHVERWTPLFEEFHRLLSPEGHVILSVDHPFHVWAKIQAQYDLGFDTTENFGLEEPTYFETEEWSEDILQRTGEDRDVVPKYRRSLTTQVNAALGTGFVLDGLEEPTPSDRFERERPVLADQERRQPSAFVCYRFRRG